MLMTQKEYVEHEGYLCPKCQARNITTISDPEVDGGIITQECKCLKLECGVRWTDTFRLDRFEITNEGKEQ